MITVTRNAATAIRNITKALHTPDGTGLRLAANPGEQTLTASLTDTPATGDLIIESDGVRLFLDPDIVGVLNGKSLDAKAIDRSGRIAFSVISSQ